MVMAKQRKRALEREGRSRKSLVRGMGLRGVVGEVGGELAAAEEEEVLLVVAFGRGRLIWRVEVLRRRSRWRKAMREIMETAVAVRK